MKPERNFVPERALAQHCPELLRTEAPPADLRPALERFGEELTCTVAANLGWLAGGEPPKVRAHALRDCTMAELAGEIAPLAANSLLAAGRANFLASLDATVVLRLVDRAFGGRGEAPAQLPESFPLSAELLIARLEGVVVSSIVKALGGEGAERIRPLRREGSLHRLAPFAAAENLMVLALEVLEAGRDPWQLMLAFPAEALAELFGQGEQRQSAKAKSAARTNPTSEPFGTLPLNLTAVLVDMRLPVSELSALRPGQILPVAVARNVPLRIGDQTIAHGTIGQIDDRVAVQITQAF